MNNSKTSIEDMEEKQWNRNKKRLITQNKKLNTEIKKLQVDINDILSSQHDESDEIQRNGESGTIKKLREQLSVQEGYLKKLKNKIDFLKSANVKGNAQYIIKQQDQLRIMKKQYDNLIVEKETVIKFKQDKLKQLQKNQPFQQHKNKIEHNLADVRAENRKMQAEITEIERDIRKYHNLQTMSKIIARDQSQTKTDIDYEVMNAKHQLADIKKKTKEIQEKWKPQFQSLDNLYFQMKAQYLAKQKALADIEKEHRMWETRKNGLRQEDQVLQFRERLSKVNTTEWKIPESSTVIKRQPRELQNYLVHTKSNKPKKQAQQTDSNNMEAIKENQQQEIDDNNKFSQVNTLDDKNTIPRKESKGKKEKQVEKNESKTLKTNKKRQKQADSSQSKTKNKQKPEEIVMLASKKQEPLKKNQKPQLKDLKLKKAKLESKPNQTKSSQDQPILKDLKLPKSPNKQQQKNKSDKSPSKQPSRTEIKSERGPNKSSSKGDKKQDTQLSKQKSDKLLKGELKNSKPENPKKGVKMILKNVGTGTS